MGWNLQGLSRGLSFNNVFPELEFRGFQGSGAPTNFLTHPFGDFISLSCPIPLSWGKAVFLAPCICIWTCFFLNSFKDYSTHNHTYACVLPHTYLRTANLTNDNNSRLKLWNISTSVKSILIDSEVIYNGNFEQNPKIIYLRSFSVSMLIKMVVFSKYIPIKQNTWD